jgi:hypothetical protein
VLLAQPLRVELLHLERNPQLGFHVFRSLVHDALEVRAPLQTVRVKDHPWSLHEDGSWLLRLPVTVLDILVHFLLQFL